jgi:hypothetical protein
MKDIVSITIALPAMPHFKYESASSSDCGASPLQSDVYTIHQSPCSDSAHSVCTILLPALTYRPRIDLKLFTSSVRHAMECKGPPAIAPMLKS